MEEIKYPENLHYREEVALSGKSVSHLADKLGISRETLSRMINGKYKGENFKAALDKELGIETSYEQN